MVRKLLLLELHIDEERFHIIAISYASQTLQTK